MIYIRINQRRDLINYLTEVALWDREKVKRFMRSYHEARVKKLDRIGPSYRVMFEGKNISIYEREATVLSPLEALAAQGE